MSIRDKLRDFGKVNSAESFRTKLDELGIQVMSDERLFARIDIISGLHSFVIDNVTAETPEAKFELIKRKLDITDGILRKAGIPWGRPGSRPMFAKFMGAYEKMLAKTRSHLVCVSDLLSKREVGERSTDPQEELAKMRKDMEIDRSEMAWRTQSPTQYFYSRRHIDKSELVRVTETYLNDAPFPFALLLSDLCFLEMDVVPSWSMTLRKPEEQQGFTGRSPQRRQPAGGDTMGTTQLLERMDSLERTLKGDSIE